MVPNLRAEVHQEEAFPVGDAVALGVVAAGLAPRAVVLAVLEA